MALLAVLVPLILTLHGRVLAEVATVRGDVAEVRRDVHALAERVARIEGAMNPWRPPTNGTPAPATSSPPGTE